MRQSAFPQRRHRRLGVYALLGTVALLTAQPAQSGNVNVPFNAANFSHPLAIDNPLFPLVAGTTMIFRADTPDGCEETRTIVTNGTKSIAGITTRVVHDAVFVGPTCTGKLRLSEDTLDWYAQDDAGNVWYMGEDTKDCVKNRCTPGAGSWEAGVNGATPGFIMLANPAKNDRYRQEYLAGAAEDEALVLDTDIDVTLSRSDALQPRLFHHCLKTKEYTALEPGANAYKYYCPGIGEVAEEDLQGGRIRAERIDPGALALQFRTVH
jgi:hypothetical protein